MKGALAHIALFSLTGKVSAWWKVSYGLPGFATTSLSFLIAVYANDFYNLQVGHLFIACLRFSQSLLHEQKYLVFWWAGFPYGHLYFLLMGTIDCIFLPLW